MSRSNPTANAPNPCTRWFEWDGSDGEVRYYDRASKKNVVIGQDFTFLLLDETATIKGWHDGSDSGIYSNEVRDTTAEPLVVKAFKAQHPIASGFYRDQRDRIIAEGGHFTTNLYIGYRPDGTSPLAIGALQIKGSTLNVWVEFRKKNRSEIYKKAVRIKGYTEGKKGKIVFRVPILHLVDVTSETEKEAIELDKEVQEYFKMYFAKKRTEQAAPPDDEERTNGRHDEPRGPVHPHSHEPPPYEPPPSEPDDDEIPF